LAIYPAITAVLAALEPLGILKLALPLRTLVLTAILVPIMVLLPVPLLHRWLAGWLRA
jgi:antibiotic biosynthesis monooxygenase (ABM) superfamily enzyme